MSGGQNVVREFKETTGNRILNVKDYTDGQTGLISNTVTTNLR